MSQKVKAATIWLLLLIQCIVGKNKRKETAELCICKCINFSDPPT